jgi:hypothetical protein
MRNATETLGIGSPAPPFTLAAANRPQNFSLSELTAGGGLIIEFLRGTW